MFPLSVTPTVLLLLLETLPPAHSRVTHDRQPLPGR
jgi:hypothetical protein